jgi:hypothetical protein
MRFDARPGARVERLVEQVRKHVLDLDLNAFIHL